MSDYTSQIRTFGALGYSSERIADILGLKGPERTELIVRLSLHGDTYQVAYNQGKAYGEYNIDAELAKKAEKGEVDAITTLAERSKERKLKDLRKTIFGI